jgi:predicted O-linked N-acetylglucosamine transferase (SPINDLY family)
LVQRVKNFLANVRYCLRRSFELDLLKQAIELHRQGNLTAARELYQRTLTLSPNHPQALSMFGVLEVQRGDLEAGLSQMQLAVDAAPEIPDTHRVAAETLIAADRMPEAVACLNYGLSQHPSDVLLNRRLMEVYCRLKDYSAAIRQASVLLAQQPTDGSLLEYLGNLHQESNQPALALPFYQRSLLVEPSRATTYNNYAAALQSLGRLSDAIDLCRAAIRLSPQYWSAHISLGRLYEQNQQTDLALSAFEQATILRPESVSSLLAVIHRKQHQFRWDDLTDQVQALQRLVASDDFPTSPEELFESPFAFQCLPIDTTSPEQLSYARKWSRQFRLLQTDSASSSHEIHLIAANRPARIRVGYLSADFHDHATGWMLGEMLEGHDRSRFEIFGYSIGRDESSPLRRRLEAAFDSFQNLKDTTDEQAALIIAQDRLEILIDLKGYTQESRPRILAQRPAPIQVHFLGYPGTLGADFVDYLIADEFVIPPAEHVHYQETIVYVPGCYQVNDSQAAPPIEKPSRADFGLPDDAIVLGCFNNPYKLTEDVFCVWLEWFKTHPKTVLWFIDAGASANQRLRQRWVAADLSPDRLIFAQGLPRDQHLARLPCIDLFIDTFPVTAHTTASDALRMGVPLLAIAGQRFISRVAGSLLNHLGLRELIASDLADYSMRGHELLSQPQRLADVRQKLRLSLASTDLFDGRRFAKKLETAFEEMRRHSVAKWEKRLHDRGQALCQAKVFDEAAETYRLAIHVNPSRRYAYINRGLCFEKLGRYHEAHDEYRRGLAVHPNDAQLHYRDATVCQILRLADESLNAFERAIELDPQLVEARFDLGLLHQSLGNLDVALELCREAVQTKPSLGRLVVANLCQHLCLWDEAKNWAESALKELEQPEYVTHGSPVHPLGLMSLPIEASPALQFKAAQRWASLHDFILRTRLSDLRKDSFGSSFADRKTTSASSSGLSDQKNIAKGRSSRLGDRLTIGYLSADFREHPMGNLMADWFPFHDRKKFRILAYAINTPDDSQQQKVIRDSCDAFREIHACPHRQAAELIASDGVDLLIDLHGYTRHARTEILAWHPGKAQVQFLGYPGTSGTSFMDYVISDSWIAPLQHQPCYSERILHLKSGLMPLYRTMPQRPDQAMRRQFGLPHGQLVLAAFSSPYKFNATIFDLWLKALLQFPGSVLWLSDLAPATRKNLEAYVTQAGLDLGRLIYTPRVELSLHQQRLQLADVLLDTFPYNQHSTAREALQVGLPVLTWSGSTYASRVAGSMLQRLGLSDLIAFNADEYQQKLMRFCDDSQLRVALRERLNIALDNDLPSNAERWVRDLESVYLEIGDQIG